MQALDEPPPLIADAMLGRLCRWLRLLGYDTLYAGDRSDIEIAALARAQERVVLTRDRGMAQRKGIRCLLLSGQTLSDQLDQVRRSLGISHGQTRCSQCNTVLEEMPPALARERVPPYVWATQAHFYHCCACDRVYWHGTHWDGVQTFLQDRVNEYVSE